MARKPSTGADRVRTGQVALSVPSTFAQYKTLLAKDLQQEFRTKEMLMSMGIYALLVLIVYGAALETGAITPGTALRDAPIAEYDEVTNVHWKPKSGNKFRGIVLAQEALAASLNAPIGRTRFGVFRM